MHSIDKRPTTRAPHSRRTLPALSSKLWLTGWLLLAVGIAAVGVLAPSRAPVVKAAAPIQRASLTSTAPNTVNIEDLRVGDRVMENLSTGELASETAVDRATWKKLTLHAQETWPDGTVDDTYVVTLQPPEWVESTGATVGAEVPIPLDLVEMGTRPDLTARVVAIGPCPPTAEGPGRVVLTTVSHLNRFLFDLAFVSPTGEIDSVRTTGYHKFYRQDDQTWVSAVDLKTGDTLLGVDGPLLVESLERVPGTHRVYNLTVEGEHVYRVAELGALVHNNDCRFQDHHIISDKNPLTKDHELLELAEFDLQSRRNKIFLPTDASYHPTRSIHSGKHLGSVSRDLAEQMDQVVEVGKRAGWSKSQYQEALSRIRSNERQLLRSGHRVLNKHKRPWAE